MKEKIKNFFKDGRAAIVLVIVLEIIITLLVGTFGRDDEFFTNLGTNGENLFSILSGRYNTWSSRVIIEGILILIAPLNKIVWVVLNALMMGLLTWSVSKLFIEKENKSKLNMIFALLFISYPVSFIASAGWKATTINYMWPLALTFYSMIPIKKYYIDEKLKWFEYPLYSLALIFACNMEQTCAILFGTYLLFMILLIIKEKKARPYMIVQFILTHLSLVFILKSPGNAIRTNAEIASTFRDYECLSFIEKLGVGLTSSIGDIIKWSQLPACILSLIIVFSIYSLYKEKIFRFIAMVPAVLITYFTFFGTIFENIFRYSVDFSIIFMTPELTLTTANVNNVSSMLPIFLALIYYLFTLLSILILFKTLKNGIPALIYVVGLLSRIILGFSPTVFISAPRPMIFFDFAMLTIIVLIMQKLLKEENKEKIINLFSNGIGIVALISVLNNIMFIL